MKITGVGPKVGIKSAVYFLIAVLIHLLTVPFFNITQNHYPVIMIAGIILILVGSFLLLIMAKNLQKSFKNDILMTEGPYKYFRNPMYAMYLIFIIPGFSLLFNSWLVLTTIIVMYILMRMYIREEYEYLYEKYRNEYKTYLEKVWLKFL